jgi:hypothetical protein
VISIEINTLGLFLLIAGGAILQVIREAYRDRGER